MTLCLSNIYVGIPIYNFLEHQNIKFPIFLTYQNELWTLMMFHYFRQNNQIGQESIYRSGLCCSGPGRQKKGKNTAICQKVTVLCPSESKYMVLMVLKPSSLAKKYRKLPVKNCLLFISCSVSQWQYKKAILSALGVAPKKHQQA